LKYAYSFDNGLTWLGNTASTPAFDHTIGYPSQNKIGDYYDIVSTNLGANVVFSATFNGGQDVYYMRLTPLPGDWNGDGKVDAADYVVWRNGFGTVFTQDHYNIWRAHFGQIAGSGAADPPSRVPASAEPLSAAVPEPATLILMILAAAGWCLRRR
jgi:PEP-CTERM motif-containing protein